MKRVVSGIQPTGNLHLGNYLGAIRNWVRMQDEVPECLFFLADLHAITVWNEPTELRANIRAMAAALIAAGIDPERSVLFPQSLVPEHAELSWVLNCIARIGWLNRMTQFKEKSGKDREGASIGLFAYPVLQAADVLLYKATHVPVGEDQKQHLELARDIAQKFNSDYGFELFPLPEPYIQGRAARVMSLRDGTSKMSKSDPSDMSRINLTDDADTIATKIKKAKTDPELLPGDPKLLEARPEAANLVAVYASLADLSEEQVLAQFEGKGFGAFKPALAELTVAKLAPITARYNDLRRDVSHLDSMLARGAERAAAIARPVMAEVHDTVGFLRR
jgi:tryptophanyl-tRNA synthetase